MASLATLDDLAAIGAVAVDIEPTDDLAVRAQRLIELASASVLGYIGTDEATVDGWADVSKDSLSTIVAEIAARRIYSPAAPSSNQLDGGAPGFLTSRLTAGDKAALDAISEVAAIRNPAAAIAISVFPTSAVHLPWCDSSLGATSCSCGVDIAGVPIYEGP